MALNNGEVRTSRIFDLGVDANTGKTILISGNAADGYQDTGVLAEVANFIAGIDNKYQVKKIYSALDSATGPYEEKDELNIYNDKVLIGYSILLNPLEDFTTHRPLKIKVMGFMAACDTPTYSFTYPTTSTLYKYRFQLLLPSRMQNSNNTWISEECCLPTVSNETYRYLQVKSFKSLDNNIEVISFFNSAYSDMSQSFIYSIVIVKENNTPTKLIYCTKITHSLIIASSTTNESEQYVAPNNTTINYGIVCTTTRDANIFLPFVNPYTGTKVADNLFLSNIVQENLIKYNINRNQFSCINYANNGVNNNYIVFPLNDHNANGNSATVNTGACRYIMAMPFTQVAT